VYRLGPFDPALGGSVLAQVVDPGWRSSVPAVDYDQLRAEIRTVLQAYQAGWSEAVHDISEGGLLAAATEMCLGPVGRGVRGLDLDLSELVAEGGDFAACFAEGGGFLVEVAAEHASEFEAAAREHGARCLRVGSVAEEAVLNVTGLEQGPARIGLDELGAAREMTMPRMLSREES
jgi:phosphoribosylformylglycinamidine synthase